MVQRRTRPARARAGVLATRGSRTVGAAAALVALVPAGGCASWDDAAFFPADYQDHYTLLSSCKKSSHPSGDYVVVWANGLAAEAFTSGARPFPEGAVLVKTQYNDSACSELSSYTSMRKAAAGTAPERADWQWQTVREGKGVGKCCDGGNPGDPSSCVGCHTPCAGQDMVCSQP